MAQLKWEEIKHNRGFYLNRAKVFGGWLVSAIDDVFTTRSTNTTVWVSSEESTHSGSFGSEWRTSITFVPDPAHEWKLDQ
jgi:hypothetical protein